MQDEHEKDLLFAIKNSELSGAVCTGELVVFRIKFKVRIYGMYTVINLRQLIRKWHYIYEM